MWWGYGYHGGFFPFFGWLAFPLTLLVVLLVFRLLFFRRAGWGYAGGGCGWRGAGHDAEAVLRRRLAAGEIDEAEYRRVREILRG